MLHAYQLRKEYEGLDPDTTISQGDGADLPVGRLFADAPDGVVVLDDTNPEQVRVAQTLETYFAVKTTTVPEPVSAKRAKQATKTDQGDDARKEG